MSMQGAAEPVDVPGRVVTGVSHTGGGGVQRAL